MRIALVSFAFGEYTIRLASALAEHADVGLWLNTSQAKAHLDLMSDAVDFKPFEKPRMRHPIRQLRTMPKLVREIRDFNPDVVHVQQGYLWFNPALVFLREFPLVVTAHDPRPHLGDRNGLKTPQWIMDLAFRRANRVIVHAEELRSAVADRGVPSDQVDVVPMLVHGGEGDTLRSAEEQNLVLFFGRIWPYKGLDYLIRAEPLIAESVPDVKIAIAGAGEDFARYRELMVSPERFEVHNRRVSEEEQGSLFRRASVVALPYVEATQSAVIPTAYNFSKPVVATTVGGLPSLVDDGETGYLVPPRDVRALASALVRLLENPELRHRLGDNAKAKVSQMLDARKIALATLNVYDRVLATEDDAEHGA